jgi:hypothetical protein
MVPLGVERVDMAPAGIHPLGNTADRWPEPTKCTCRVMATFVVATGERLCALRSWCGR